MKYLRTSVLVASAVALLSGAGAGPVGYLAAHQCQLAGFDVTGVEPNSERRAEVQQSGIRQVLASFPVDDPSYKNRVALVIDCSGHEQAVLDGCKVVRKCGEVVLVGVPWKARTAILAHEILHEVFFNYVLLRSGWEWEVPLTSRSFVWEELYEGYNNAPHSTFSGLATALKWLAAGRIPLSDQIHMMKPSDPSTVYHALLNGKIRERFVVLDWDQS